MADFNEDGTHETVMEKHDVTGDGIYNVFKYGSVDQSGEINFDSIVLEAEPDQTDVQKSSEIKKTEWFATKSYMGIDARRTLYTTSITTIDSVTYYRSVQEDLDQDGTMDLEVSYEAVYNKFEVSTYTKEITEIKYWLSDDIIKATEELRVSSYSDSRLSQRMTVVDIVNGEPESTRVYEDAFPNELSEIAGIENYLISTASDSETLSTPDLSAVFTFSHNQDNIPAEFDRMTKIEGGELITSNLLTMTQTVEIPGSYSVNGEGFNSYAIDAVKAVPAEGTYWSIELDSPASSSIKDEDGYYLYFDSSDDGIYETVFVMDKYDNVVGIGFDYDQDSHFIPGETTDVQKDIVWNKNYASIFADDEYLHFNEIHTQVGKFNEPTFTDVLFDVNKMAFSFGGSQLTSIAEKFSTSIFEESVDFVFDLVTQIVAGIAGIVGGIIGTKAGHPTLGFLAGYLGVTLAAQSIKIAEYENLVAHQTFRVVGSASDKTLGVKYWFDDMFASVMPMTMFGSYGGVYAPVYGRTNERNYNAEILLAEFNMLDEHSAKASSFTTSYNYPKLDYWLTTRNIWGYSDFNDLTVRGYLQSINVVHADAFGFGIAEYIHEGSSIYRIEDQLLRATDDLDETDLNTLVPTIDYDYANGMYSPRYSFVDSTKFPAPEYYTEYPVFVEKGSSRVNEYVSIYKKVSIDDPDEATSIKIPVFDENTNLKVDIVSIDCRLIWTKITTEGDNTKYETESSWVATINPDEFKVDLTTGDITILSVEPETDNVVNDLPSTLSTILSSYKSRVIRNTEESLDGDNTLFLLPFLLFEIKVEKYRSVSDLRDNQTSEDVNKITTAQAIEAAILEYNYQFNLATQTQMAFHEIVYTATITAISTAIMMACTYGMGKLADSLLKAISAKQTAGISVSHFTKTLGKELLQITSSYGASITATRVATSIVSELAQELLLDPLIETTVGGAFRRMGFNPFVQMLASSFAEAGRESITGPISRLFSSKQQQGQLLMLQLQNLHQKVQEGPVVQQTIDQYNQLRQDIAAMEDQKKLDMTAIGKSMNIISFFIIARSSTDVAFFGQVDAMSTKALKLVADKEAVSIKSLFEKKFDSSSTTDTFNDREVPESSFFKEQQEAHRRLVLLATQPGMRMGIHLADNFGPGFTTAVRQQPSSAEAFDALIDVLKGVLARESLVDTMEFEGNPNYVKLDALEEFVDLKTPRIRQYKSRLAKNEHIPNIISIASIYLSLVKYVKSEVKISNWRLVDIAFRDFFNAYKIQSGFSADFKGFRKLYLSPSSLDFSEFKRLKGVPNTKTPNRDLLMSWISNAFLSEFPQYHGAGDRRGFSRPTLLNIFYRRSGQYGVFKKAVDYINLYKLFELLYYNEEISASYLKSFGIKEANEFNVEILKKNIKGIIKKFIFSNVYDTKYVYSKHFTRDPQYFKPEFDLCLDLYLAFSRENGGPLDLESFTRELETHAGFTFRTSASIPRWDTLVKIIGEFRGSHYRLGVLMKKLSGENYRLAAAAIRDYLSEREIKPDPEYHEEWLDSEVVDSHLIFLTLRNVGFDIQNLEKIPERAFQKRLRDYFKFVRHHIFKNDKKSIDINRLVLTLKGLHRQLESLDPNVVVQLVNELIDWNNKKCPDFYKGAIPNDWNDAWSEVLERREFIKKQGVGNFLLEYYEELIIRVFGYKVKNPQVIENRIKQLYHSWINEGNGTPVLPVEILRSLGLTSSQTLITNYLGNQP